MIFSKRCVFCEDGFKKADCVWYDRFICICSSCMNEIDEQNIHHFIDVPPPLSRIIPCTYYTGKVKSAVQSFKFNDNKGYEKAFSFIAERELNKIWDLYGFDAIVTLPLSKQRTNERGYNQSQFLADTAQRVFGISIHNEYLKRPENRVKQSTLSHYERVINIQGAYTASDAVMDKNILLIDDIYTSGSTLAEAARTLKDAGANVVMGIVFSAREPRKERIEFI